MNNAISPGVYSKITVLDSYVEQVPSSNGFICIISDKGEDSSLQYVSSKTDFIKETGKPNVNRFKRWAHGSLIGERFVTASPSLYYIRVLPDDATYANLAYWLVKRPTVKITDGGSVDFNEPNNPDIQWTSVKYMGDNKESIYGVGTATTNETYFQEYKLEGRVSSIENITKEDVIPDVFDGNSFTLLPPIYIQGQTTGGETITFRMYGGTDTTGNHAKPTLIPISRLPGIKVEPTYILGNDGSSIYKLKAEIITDNTDPHWQYAYPYPNDPTRRVYVKPEKLTTTYDPNNDEIPHRFVKSYDGSKIYIIEVDTSDEIVFVDDTASYTYAPAGGHYAYEEVYPLFMIRGRGRGDYYNNYRIKARILENYDNRFEIQIFEKKEDNQYHLIETPYYVSFDPGETDDSGESLFITNILNKYPNDIRVYLDEEHFDETKTHIMVSSKQIFDDAPYVSPYRKVTGTYVVDDIVYKTDDIPDDNPDIKYYFVKDKAQGYLYDKPSYIITHAPYDPSPSYDPYHNTEIVPAGELIYNKKDGEMYIHVGFGKIIKYDPYMEYTTMKTKDDVIDIADYTFVNAHQYFTDAAEDRDLSAGSLGTLINPATNEIDTAVATKILTNAYAGITDNNVLSVDNIWFDLVFAGGYPRDVKDKAVELTKLRRDCIAILDLDDNLSAEVALKKRSEIYYYNTWYAALYEPYRKIREPYSGKDIWVSPVYHTAWLIAMNDRINPVWYAVAGFERGMAEGIKQLRYSPNQTDRDTFYLNQINPTVHFREGTVLWGQLTAHRKPDAMQNLNIVRTVLYIKRALENYTRYFIFDLNDVYTWKEIENGIAAFLKEVKEARGLYDYSVKVFADEYMRRKKEARAAIVLEPMRDLEKLFLDFYIK